MITFYNICPEEPYFRFKDKYDQALNKNQQLIEAIAISSYSSKTQEVDVRFVNLKIIDGRDFIFFTNYCLEMPRIFSDRRRSNSTVVSKKIDSATKHVAIHNITGLISWRIPAHICFGIVN